MLLLLSCVVFLSCKKPKPETELSPVAYIDGFLFKAEENPGVLQASAFGEIGYDTIRVKLPKGTPLTALKPTVGFKGKSISPQSGQVNDFSSTVIYTVTAENGSQRKYKVVISLYSEEKEITSFIFEAANNPGLTADVVGKIEHDTIQVPVPPGISLKQLVPTIVFKGTELQPLSGVSQDFTSPLMYRVWAEDQTIRVYTVMCSRNATVYVAGTAGRLYALDAVSGKQKWMFQATGGVPHGTGALSSPTFYEGRLYVTCDDGMLYVLDAETGIMQWQFSADNNPIYSSPTVKDGTVYISGYSDYLSLVPGYIYALNASTGDLKWKYRISYPTNLSVGSGVVCSGSGGYGIFALDTATGNLKWNFGAGITKSMPTYANGVFYSGGEGYELFALDAENGSAVWKHSGTGGDVSPTVAGDKLYAMIGNSLACYDAATGISKWQFASIRPLVTPVYENDLLFTAGGAFVYAIDASTGAQKWMIGDLSEANMPAHNLTVVNGVLYAGQGQNSFCAFDALSGKLIWKFITQEPVYAGACVVDVNGNATQSGDAGNHK